MRKSIITAVAAICILALAGCGSVQKAQPLPENSPAAVPMEVSEQPLPCGIEFEAQYIRTDGYAAGGSYPRICWITGPAELRSYYESNAGVGCLDLPEQPLPDRTMAFADAAAKYDDAFFKEHELILVVLEENSGSVRHSVKELLLTPASKGEKRYCLQPVIERHVPQTGTADMAEWHILIEVAKEYASACCELRLPQLVSEDKKAGTADSSAPVREDRCELYLQVLEDLWQTDSGLNDGVSVLGMDLSGLSHLNDREQEHVAAAFAARRRLAWVKGTWDELCDQGYIDREELCWQDGLFFCIRTDEQAVWNLPCMGPGDPVPELTAFEAYKWRSGLGAYFFGDCAAQKNADGTWTYHVGQEAIS